MHRLSFLLVGSLCLLGLPLAAVAEPLAIPPSEAVAAHMQKGPDLGDFTRTCPPGLNDTPAMPSHYSQATILNEPLNRVFSLGQQIFVTNFNACDGAGRPASTGTGAARTADPVLGPRNTRVSGPEADSCAGCHNQPQPGGAGDFVANVFVLAQAADPVSRIILNEDFSNTWLERNTLGMFGSGAIEMLGREMTTDLQNQQTTRNRAGQVRRDQRHGEPAHQGRFIWRADRASGWHRRYQRRCWRRCRPRDQAVRPQGRLPLVARLHRHRDESASRDAGGRALRFRHRSRPGRRDQRTPHRRHHGGDDIPGRAAGADCLDPGTRCACGGPWRGIVREGRMHRMSSAVAPAREQQVLRSRSAESAQHFQRRLAVLLLRPVADRNPREYGRGVHRFEASRDLRQQQAALLQRARLASAGVRQQFRDSAAISSSPPSCGMPAIQDRGVIAAISTRSTRRSPPTVAKRRRRRASSRRYPIRISWQW